MDPSFPLSRQKFAPNGYSECINHSISNIPFKNVQDKKAQITIFLNKIYDNDIEKLLMKDLNYFANSLNEITHFSLNIVRTNNQKSAVFLLKNNENKIFDEFVMKLSNEIFKSFLISILDKEATEGINLQFLKTHLEYKKFR